MANPSNWCEVTNVEIQLQLRLEFTTGRCSCERHCRPETPPNGCGSPGGDWKRLQNDASAAENRAVGLSMAPTVDFPTGFWGSCFWSINQGPVGMARSHSTGGLRSCSLYFPVDAVLSCNQSDIFEGGLLVYRFGSLALKEFHRQKLSEGIALTTSLTITSTSRKLWKSEGRSAREGRSSTPPGLSHSELLSTRCVT